jgi:hypothetical protein
MTTAFALLWRGRLSERFLGFIYLYTQMRNFWNRAVSEVKSSGCSQPASGQHRALTDLRAELGPAEPSAAVCITR